MTKVIFIELPVDRKNRYICDLAEKFYEEEKTVHIFVQTKDKALQLNRDLWIWKQNSFVPHTIIFNKVEESTQIEERVIITTDEMPVLADVLIFHNPMEISKVSNYSLIIDFAEVYDAQRLKESRERYKRFRDDGKFEVSFTKIGVFLKSKV